MAVGSFPHFLQVGSFRTIDRGSASLDTDLIWRNIPPFWGERSRCSTAPAIFFCQRLAPLSPILAARFSWNNILYKKDRKETFAGKFPINISCGSEKCLRLQPFGMATTLQIQIPGHKVQPGRLLPRLHPRPTLLLLSLQGPRDRSCRCLTVPRPPELLAPLTPTPLSEALRLQSIRKIAA